MLSFSASAKAEICKEVPQSGCCALAQCFGILLFCNSFTETQIKIITESQDFARLLPRLFRKAFSVSFDTLPEAGAAGKLVFVIRGPEKIAAIMSAFGFDTGSTLSLHINLPIVEEDCCKAAFLRGAFLAGGSVTSPAKAYHLELATTHRIVSRECDALIRETLGFSPKTASRSGAQVLYLKQSELISDFLTYLGAPVAAMGIMEARLEKELNNQVNRCCNCDDANTSKVVEAAQEQLEAIRILQRAGLLAHLPDKLQLTAALRLENPELPLSELAEEFDPPVTKSCLNHRLRKLMELARSVESQGGSV